MTVRMRPAAPERQPRRHLRAVHPSDPRFLPETATESGDGVVVAVLACLAVEVVTAAVLLWWITR